MERVENIKALYIVVNVGFGDEAADIAREAGASGATIINARGVGPVHKLIMGITVDTEKEIVLILVDRDTAAKIIAAIKEKVGMKTPANGICFVIPIEKMIG